MTREDAKTMWPLIKQWSEGAELQIKHSSEWSTVKGGVDFSYEEHRYRIKPTPKLRAWRAEEVPVGRLIRYKLTTEGYNHLPALIIDSQDCPDQVVFGRSVKMETSVALRDCEHSLDYGKTWLPCGVEQ